MASGEESSAALRASLLSSLLALDPSCAQTLDDRVLELYLLRTAEMRRRRARETIARARRMRHYLRRRKRVVVSALAGVLGLVKSFGIREMWTKYRPVEGGDFWQAAQRCSDEEWKDHFHVTRATFSHLLQLLEPTITRKKTQCRIPIDARRRLAIALWWYAQNEEYRLISERFGVGITTVCIIMRQVTTAIVNSLYEEFLSLPKAEKLEAAVKAFKDQGYPQCAGAIGTTHIPIVGPRENPQDYMNSSGWYSIILQAVVDHNLMFTHVYAGWPGSNSNATVLSSSDLFLNMEDQLIFPSEKSVELGGGVQVPVHLIGDCSFPLKRWLLTGYNLEDRLSPEQRRFTHALNAARAVVPVAFTRLKGRWGCLEKRNEIEVTAMPAMVTACCILHNVCEYLGDEFLPEWIEDSDAFVQPEVQQCQAADYGGAEAIRHAMTYSFRDVYQKPTSIDGFPITYDD
ncbi:unnamed protein product [Knipowitschia caucasica]|uniref:DDE Tnp4 domain-containing protein n=1 Tax=Knipowitschia caucasica TaxID=637954 RepID=A0AAV2L015_KNICA